MHVPGKQHHATTKASAKANFRCDSCGHQARAVARAEGTGSAKNVLWLEAEGAQRAARTRAENDALNRAELLLSIAKCPNCKERGGSATLLFVAISILGGVGMMMLGLFGGAMLMQSITGTVLGGVVGTGLGVFYVLQRKELWSRAESDIVFDAD